MAETLTKHQRIERIRGSADKPGVIVNFAANLSPQATATRMRATTAAEGVTAVKADLGIIGTFQQKKPDLGRLVVVTAIDRHERPPVTLSDLLVQDVSVGAATSVEPDAIGVDYFANLNTELANRKLFGKIRDTSWQQEIPVFATVRPDRQEGLQRLRDTTMTDGKLGPLHNAARLGSDAVIINNYPGSTAKLVEATSHLNVPVYIELGGGHSPREILKQAADVREASAGGVVIGSLELPKDDDQPTLQHMIAGIAGVVRGDQSPEHAYTEITRSHR